MPINAIIQVDSIKPNFHPKIQIMAIKVSTIVLIENMAIRLTYMLLVAITNMDRENIILKIID